MMKQIAILDTGYESYNYEQQLFAKHGFHLSIYNGPDKDAVKKYAFARKAVGIMVRELVIGDDALTIMPDVKAIVRYGVGYDNIHMKAVKKRNIRVANVQGYANHSVSEHALALMFACTRDVEGSRQGEFSKPTREDVIELHNKTLGIIGIGQIGSQFSKKASPLFKRTIAYDPYKPPAHIKSCRAEKTTLLELLSESHVISLHCNLTDETRHIIDETAFGRMSNRPVIINTARGPVVDEKALLNALNSGVIHSAGLDVFEKEPPGKDQEELLEHPHVVSTPHIAWYSERSIVELQRRAADNLIGLLTGKKISDELS